MPIALFSTLHVISAILLVAINFWAFAAPRPETRKKLMMCSGIASLCVLVFGFGLHGMLHVGFPGWVILKILAWLGLSAIAGQAFRHPERARQNVMATAALAFIAVFAVYLRPF